MFWRAVMYVSSSSAGQSNLVESFDYCSADHSVKEIWHNKPLFFFWVSFVLQC